MRSMRIKMSIGVRDEGMMGRFRRVRRYTDGRKWMT